MSFLRLFTLWGIISLYASSAFSQGPKIVIDSKGHSARISNIHYSADGANLITISEDKTIKIWDVASGKMITKYESQIGDGPQGMFYASALSPDGKVLAVAGYKVNSEKENYILLLDVEKGIQIGTAKGHTDSINSLSFSGKGNYLASGSADGSVKIWQTDVPAQISLLTSLPTSGPVTCVSFNPKTQDLAISQESRDVIVFSLAGLDQGQQKFQPRVLKQHKGVVDKVLYSADGTYLVSSSFENELVLWRQDGHMLKEFGKLSDPIHALAFSSDSKILVGLDVRGRGTSWAIPGGNKFSEFKGHDNTVFCAAFSPSLPFTRTSTTRLSIPLASGSRAPSPAARFTPSTAN